MQFSWFSIFYSRLLKLYATFFSLTRHIASMLIGWVNEWSFLAPCPHPYEKFCLQLPQKNILTLNPTIYHNFHVWCLSWTMVVSGFTYIWSPRVTVWWSFQIVDDLIKLNLVTVDYFEWPVIAGICLVSKLVWPHILFVSLSAKLDQGFLTFFIRQICTGLGLLMNIWSARVKKFCVLYFSQKELPTYHLIATIVTCISGLVGVGGIWQIPFFFIHNHTWVTYHMHQQSLFWPFFSCNLHLFCTGQVLSIFSRSTSYCPANWRKQFG